MSKRDSNNNYVPNYDSCITATELEAEFKEWVLDVCLAKFDNDKVISHEYTLRQAYEHYAVVNPGEYLIFNISGEKVKCYFGKDIILKSTIQNHKNNMEIYKQKIKIKETYSGSSSNNDSNKSANYDERTRNDLKKLANVLDNKYLTDSEKEEAIEEINEKYGLNIPSDMSAKDMKSIATGYSGGLIGEVKSKIDYYTKGSGIADAFDKSENEYIRAFTDEGITGDVLWGVITGKYNKDQKAKEDLLKLSEDINNGSLTEEQKENRLAELNKKYDLKLDSSVTADELNDIIKSNQNMEYKKKVSEIAKGLVENKLNEVISNQLEQRLGPLLRSLGINFNFKDRNIIQDIRDIIRGTKRIEIDQESFMREFEEKLTDKIDKLIEDKVYRQIDVQANNAKKQIDKYADEAIKQLDVYRNKVDAINDKLEGWVNNPERFRTLIADKLDSLVKTPVENVAKMLDKIDGPLSKLGVNVGLGNMFRTMSENFMVGVADKIKTAVKPILSKALNITKTISENIRKAVEAVNELRNKAKAMVDQWKNTLKDAIAKQTKVIVDKIVQYVKLNISSLGGFSI